MLGPLALAAVGAIAFCRARARRDAGPRVLRAGPLTTTLAICVFTPALAHATESFQVEPQRSLDGVYRLEWAHPGSVRVEESRLPDFADVVVVYEGADRATTLSGRSDGLYHYRLVPLAQAQAVPVDGRHGTETLKVEVAHHPLARALTFFGVGLVVFTATVWLVVTGDRRVTAEQGRLNG